MVRNSLQLSICLTAGILLLSILSESNLPGQHNSKAIHMASEDFQATQKLRIVFYNAENLFDTLDDPGYNDAAFTPQGSRSWHFFTYRRKLINLGRVLINCGEGTLPDVIGLCEVEKRGVLEDLLRYSPLRGQGYEIIHFDSGDPRGIDVALLYRPGKIRPVLARPVKIVFSQGSRRSSRDILYARFELFDRTPLHIYVNHWPSRFGGEQQTAPLRLDAARCLKDEIDSLLNEDENVLALAMGDFNDGPQDASLQWFTSESRMNNLMLNWGSRNVGTHKHAGHWATLDQILVTPGLLDQKGWEAVNPRVLSSPYLLQEELNQPGHRPFRSFAGEVFQGGFSDHLPVFTDLIKLP
jgi:endonuclease/exonuclease/phosphatase family metal-dependent hydrolase